MNHTKSWSHTPANILSNIQDIGSCNQTVIVASICYLRVDGVGDGAEETLHLALDSLLDDGGVEMEQILVKSK